MTKIYKKIKPYIGVDDIKLGMNPIELEALLGPPIRISKNRLGARVELHENLLATYSNDQTPKIVELGFTRGCSSLSLKNIKLFEPPYRKRLAEIFAIDNNAFAGIGSVVFLDLGISLTGFSSGVDEDLAVTVFVQGRWDDAIAIGMKPFKGSES